MAKYDATDKRAASKTKARSKPSAKAPAKKATKAAAKSKAKSKKNAAPIEETVSSVEHDSLPSQAQRSDVDIVLLIVHCRTGEAEQKREMLAQTTRCSNTRLVIRR